jgi:4a-hydroxytetrahydrobiopterin dehydratase
MKSNNLPTEWKNEGDHLKGTYKFKTFPESIDFVSKIATLMEEKNHHADIDIRYNKVHLTLTTHDANNTLTDKDFQLASEIANVI